jgi:outer membrane protein OmpA-like peptidoglycan-associated protein/tetratricopeptide (TPR) repeat protein
MLKQISAIVILCSVFFVAHSQSAKEFLKQGQVQYDAQAYDKALKIYKDALKVHPQDAKLNFWTGLTYLSLPNKSESLRYLQTAFTINPKVDDRIYYFLGLSYQSNRQYQKAEEFFNEFKKRNKSAAEEVDKKIRQTQYADSLTRSPASAIVENVGKAINSSFHEYSPLVSADGNTMIFTSNRPDKAGAENGVPQFEDIYISRKVDGKWSDPEKISPNINIKFNDAAASLSPDGKTLILYYEYGGGDIYVSNLVGNEWSKPVALNENINTPNFWETSAFLTADGKKLYFTSNREANNLDIYVSEMEQTGDWGEAKSLGPVINTPGREDSPVLDSLGTTLYFSSDGHQTMGGTDIFRSEFRNGEWQKPVNLGYPINSVEDDSFFSLTGDRRRAYFSTLREEGNAEIYTLTFIEPEHTLASAILPDYNATANAETPVTAGLTAAEPASQPLSPTVESGDEQEEEIKPFASIPLLGDESVPLLTAAPLKDEKIPVTTVNKDVPSTAGKEPTLLASAQQGEQNSTPSGDVKRAIEPSSQIKKQALEVQRTKTLANAMPKPASQFGSGNRKFLFFGIGKDELNSEALSKLEDVYSLLSANEQATSLIEGHTDNTGNELLNNALSIRRANAVAKYLTRRGISAVRITVKGYGSKRPVVSNDDEIGGRELNRRIEIQFN